MSQSIPMSVSDKNSQPIAATTLVDSNGHTLYNALNDQPMTAPTDYSPSAAIAAAEANKNNPAYLGSFGQGYSNDLQRSYDGSPYDGTKGHFVPSFTPIAAYNFGLQAAAYGISYQAALLGAGILNVGAAEYNSVVNGNDTQLNNVSPSALGNNVERAISIAQGYADYSSGRWGNTPIAGSGSKCFPAGTPVSVSDNISKAIELVRVGDAVVCYNEGPMESSNLPTSRVARLFRNITNEWLILSCGLTVTPGHHFLNEQGGFERIDSIVQRSGMIVSADGNCVPVTAERIMYSDKTRHLYEEAEDVINVTVGNAALAPEIKRGWRTYNFEVEELHTYIAGGYRVHNDSIDAFNALADVLSNPNLELASAAFASLSTQFGPGVALDASLGVSLSHIGEEVSAPAAVNSALQQAAAYQAAGLAALASGDVDTAAKAAQMAQTSFQAAEQANDAVAATGLAAADKDIQGALAAAAELGADHINGFAQQNYGDMAGLQAGLTAAGLNAGMTTTTEGPDSTPNGDPTAGYSGGYSNPAGGLAGGTDPSQGPGPDDSGSDDPLILNLVGGQVHTTDAATSTVKFDDGAGQSVLTGWITPGEGILAFDPAGTAITRANQLITGFAELAAFDFNDDGKIDGSDSIYSQLRLWEATGTDPTGAPTGALLTLAQAGIASIGLRAEAESTYDNGNALLADGSFSFSDGSQGDIAEAVLMNGNLSNTIVTTSDANSTTIRFGTGAATTFVTGTGQTVDAGATGVSAVVDLGTNNTVTAGAASEALLIGGDNSTLRAGSAQNAVLIGYGNNVTLQGNGGTDTLVTLGDNSTVLTAQGSTNQIYVEGNTSTVHAGQGTSTVTVDGDSDTLFLGQNGTAALNGAGDMLDGGLKGGDTVTVSGQNATVAVTGSTVSLADGLSTTVGGSGNTISGRNGIALTLTGSADATTLTGMRAARPRRLAHCRIALALNDLAQAA